MTTEQWNTLSLKTRERLIEEVFNSSYLSAIHAARKPDDDSIIKEVLSCSEMDGDKIYINIHNTVKVK